MALMSYVALLPPILVVKLQWLPQSEYLKIVSRLSYCDFKPSSPLPQEQKRHPAGDP